MLTRRVVMQTLNGPETIEGATVRALKEILKNANDDAVVVFMFETTPTVRDQMSKWMVEWAPIYDGSTVIEVQVQCAAETSQDERTAAYNRLNEFAPALAVPLGRSRGIAFNMSIEVTA